MIVKYYTNNFKDFLFQKNQDLKPCIGDNVETEENFYEVSKVIFNFDEKHILEVLLLE